MKRIIKEVEPPTLAYYRHNAPNSSWEQMRNDHEHQGQQAYKDCRAMVVAEQKGLCAYCEIDIRDNNPLQCRVEHFHPKSDQSAVHNWALDWGNMIGVCNGGSNECVQAPGFFLLPIDQNLSCDAHKDRKIQKKELPEVCEGWILSPLDIQIFPCLFRLDKSTGALHPNSAICATVNIPGNQHPTTKDLVSHTIVILNLNCDRLIQERRRVIFHIEHNKKLQRQKGFSPQQGLTQLVQRYFTIQWPAFFTTIRLCLGDAAEAHLQSIGFQG